MTEPNTSKLPPHRQPKRPRPPKFLHVSKQIWVERPVKIGVDDDNQPLFEMRGFAIDPFRGKPYKAPPKEPSKTKKRKQLAHARKKANIRLNSGS